MSRIGILLAFLLLSVQATSALAQSAPPQGVDAKDFGKMADILLQSSPPHFPLAGLENDLRKIAPSLYLGKAKAIRFAADRVEESNDPRMRLFIMNAIQPIIDSTHTQYFESDVIPNFDESVGRSNAQNGIRSLADFASQPGGARMALELTRAALDGSAEFVATSADRAMLKAIKATVGNALASSLMARDLQQAQAELEQNEAALFHMSEGIRSRGFGQMATALVEYLKSVR